jgi:hypothetical protein
MVKCDYIRKVSLVVGEEKYAIVGQFEELVATCNGDFINGRITVVGKPAKYEYEKTFEEQELPKGSFSKMPKKSSRTSQDGNRLYVRFFKFIV